MKITIERKKWSFNKTNNLLFDGQKYCVLGFFGKALGITDEEMAGQWRLSVFENDYPILSWLTKPVTWGNQNHSNQSLLTHLNDSSYVKNRESEIKKFLKMAKIDVEFV